MMRGWVVGWIRTCLKKIIFDTFNCANLEIKSPQSKHQVTCPASSASSPKSLRFHWTNYEKMVSDWNGWRRVERTHCVCNEMYRFILFFFWWRQIVSRALEVNNVEKTRSLRERNEKKIQFSRFCCQYEFFLCNFQSSLILLCGPGWRAIVVGEILYIFSTLCTRCAMREAKRRNEQDKRYFHLARALAKCTNFQSTTFLRAECFVAWFLRCRVASCPHMDFSFWFFVDWKPFFSPLFPIFLSFQRAYDFSEWRHFRSQAERAIVGDLTVRDLNTGFLSYPL